MNQHSTSSQGAIEQVVLKENSSIPTVKPVAECIKGEGMSKSCVGTSKSR